MCLVEKVLELALIQQLFTSLTMKCSAVKNSLKVLHLRSKHSSHASWPPFSTDLKEILERKKKLFSLNSDPRYKPAEWWYKKSYFFIILRIVCNVIFSVFTIYIIIQYLAIAISFFISCIIPNDTGIPNIKYILNILKIYSTTSVFLTYLPLVENHQPEISTGNH